MKKLVAVAGLWMFFFSQQQAEAQVSLTGTDFTYYLKQCQSQIPAMMATRNWFTMPNPASGSTLSQFTTPNTPDAYSTPALTNMNDETTCSQYAYISIPNTLHQHVMVNVTQVLSTFALTSEFACDHSHAQWALFGARGTNTVWEYITAAGTAGNWTITNSLTGAGQCTGTSTSGGDLLSHQAGLIWGRDWAELQNSPYDRLVLMAAGPTHYGRTAGCATASVLCLRPITASVFRMPNSQRVCYWAHSAAGWGPEACDFGVTTTPNSGPIDLIQFGSSLDSGICMQTTHGTASNGSPQNLSTNVCGGGSAGSPWLQVGPPPSSQMDGLEVAQKNWRSDRGYSYRVQNVNGTWSSLLKDSSPAQFPWATIKGFQLQAEPVSGIQPIVRAQCGSQLCDPGHPNPPTIVACEAYIYSIDPYCATTVWDTTCNEEFQQYCHTSLSGP